jgi:Fur family ferric uptake transcriptional regulator
MKNTAIHPEVLLKRIGSKVTPGRVKILEMLEKEPKPLTIEELQKKVGKGINGVTLYRNLEALAKAGIVERSDLRHGHAHYELRLGRPHHHHIVCTNCGRIEDINLTHPTISEKEVLKRSKEFASVDDYSLEFYGICKKCAKKLG